MAWLFSVYIFGVGILVLINYGNTRVSETLNVTNTESETWSHLTLLTRLVYDVQLQVSNPVSERQNYVNDVIYILFDTWTETRALSLQVFLAQSEADVKFIVLDILAVIQTNLSVISLSSNIKSVFLLSTSQAYVTTLLTTVGYDVTFRWTALKHVAEWVVVTPCDCLHLIHKLRNRPDFITFIFTSGERVLFIAQSSRKPNIDIVARFHIISGSVPDITTDPELSIATDQGNVTLIDAVSDLVTSGRLRMHARVYLSSQKSALDGLDLPVSMFVTVADDVKQCHDGDCLQLKNDVFLSLVQMLSASLGFRYHVLLVEDGGFFGAVTPEGVTGITGHLARREAAISMSLSMIDNRLGHIDYVPLPISLRSNYIVYKLPSPGDRLDTTLLDIVSPDFVVFLLGPLCFTAVVGAVVHVVTRSCTSASPQPLTLTSFRELWKFPGHCCLDADKACASQSGRILKASWGIFWIIVGSAYSAYMTTSFAVKSRELTLTSLDDLLQHPEMQLGINRRMTALITLLESSADDPVLSRTWRKLLEQNSTNPMTFSDNVTYHVEKVLEGNYAFMTALPENGISLRAMMQEFPSLRVKELQDYPSINLDYIGLPTNCFYRDELYRSLLTLQELHLTFQLHDYRPATTEATKVNDQAPIGFSRIVLLLCVVAGGTGLAGVCLVAEVVLAWNQRLRQRC